MKYSKFWIKEAFDITVKGKSQRIQLLVGSDLSKDDALAQAKLRAELIEQRIAQVSQRKNTKLRLKSMWRRLLMRIIWCLFAATAPKF